MSKWTRDRYYMQDPEAPPPEHFVAIHVGHRRADHGSPSPGVVVQGYGMSHDDAVVDALIGLGDLVEHGLSGWEAMAPPTSLKPKYDETRVVPRSSGQRRNDNRRALVRAIFVRSARSEWSRKARRTPLWALK